MHAQAYTLAYFKALMESRRLFKLPLGTHGVGWDMLCAQSAGGA